MSDLSERIFEKALTAVRGRDTKTALALLAECIKLKPDFYEAWVVRGNVLHSNDQHFEALLHYDRALSIKDTIHDAWNNRGLAFADIGMFAEAEKSFRKSAELLPAVEPHMGLANMYCTIMRLKDAADEYREAIKINPGLFDARFNLGVTLLGLGQWEEGFREYEYRWQNTPYPPRSYRNYKKWQGEDLTGKRILLYPEQGYGDEILAMRFANTIAEKYFNSYVILQARTPMLRLAEEAQCWTNNASAVITVSLHEDTEWRADYSCPLLDVPMVLGLKPEEVSCEAYLRPKELFDEEGHVMIDYPWFERVKALPPGLNVGLCWSSGTHLETARAAQQSKSIKLEWLRPLAMPGVNLISLQKPRVEATPDGMTIHDWMDDCHDFNDTAALIEELDLVISVDTAVAHLAGALGKPTWNFVRYSGYWPWLAVDVAESPTHSIWYPTMKLLRQPKLFAWSEPIETATKWLKAEVEQVHANACS